MAKQTIRPLEDRVVIQQIEAEEKTAGGIVLPDTAKEKPQEGVIRAVGSGRITDKGTKVDMHVKVGDRVLYRKYSGSEVKIEGTEYLIIPEKDILAIVDKVPAGV